jgi:hypothetical protein
VRKFGDHSRLVENKMLVVTGLAVILGWLADAALGWLRVPKTEIEHKREAWKK